MTEILKGQRNHYKRPHPCGNMSVRKAERPSPRNFEREGYQCTIENLKDREGNWNPYKPRYAFGKKIEVSDSYESQTAHNFTIHEN